jgi:hypothetical protein
MHCHYHQQSLIVFDEIKIKILFSFLTVKVDAKLEVGHYLLSKGNFLSLTTVKVMLHEP